MLPSNTNEITHSFETSLTYSLAMGGSTMEHTERLGFLLSGRPQVGEKY